MDVSAHTPDPDRARPPAELGEDGLRKLLAGLTAVRDGDLSARLPDDAGGLLGEIATIYNAMVEQLRWSPPRSPGSPGRWAGRACSAVMRASRGCKASGWSSPRASTPWRTI